MVRPISPTLHATLEFSDAVGAVYTTSLDTAVTNKVPPWPFIDSVTLVADITGQPLVRERRPITFTVTQVTGGVPPFLYQFKINGFLMRDWSTDSVWVWDAQTLNNTPTVSGGYTCTVSVRRSSFSLSEQTGSTSFTLLLSEAANRPPPFPFSDAFARRPSYPSPRDTFD